MRFLRKNQSVLELPGWSSSTSVVPALTGDAIEPAMERFLSNVSEFA